MDDIGFPQLMKDILHREKHRQILASNMTVLHGNDAFSILEFSTKKRYSSFLKKVFVFQKVYFKVSKSNKNMPISLIEGYFENP